MRRRLTGATAPIETSRSWRFFNRRVSRESQIRVADARRLLYSGGIELTRTVRLRAKAIRYGYRQGGESSAGFEIP